MNIRLRVNKAVIIQSYLLAWFHTLRFRIPIIMSQKNLLLSSCWKLRTANWVMSWSTYDFWVSWKLFSPNTRLAGDHMYVSMCACVCVCVLREGVRVCQRWTFDTLRADQLDPVPKKKQPSSRSVHDSEFSMFSLTPIQDILQYILQCPDATLASARIYYGR